MAIDHLFPRPDLARQYLQLLLDRPHIALSLFGPHQIGKTTFIQRDLSELAHAKRIRPIYVDLMAAADKLEAINGALREELDALKSRRSQERVTAVRALGVGINFEAAPPAPASTDAGQQVQHLVAAILRQPGAERILWLLDEVQELAKTNGDRAMMAVRAVANRHKADGRVLLLMTGSSKEGLTRLFAAHGSPSFGLAERQDFPVLGRDYVEFVLHRANAPRARARKLKADEFVAAFAMLGHRPADLEAFVGHVATYNIQDVVGAVPTFLKTRYPEEQLEQRFAAMTPLQRILLAEIATGAVELTGKKMMAVVAKKLGTEVSASGIRQALTSLPSDVLSNPERGVYEIPDPILASWLRRRRVAERQ